MNPTTQTVEKEWKDKSDSEKIESLKDVVLSYQNTFNYMNRTISELQTTINRLKNHYHAEGRVVIAIDNINSGMGMSESASIGRKNPLL